MGLFSCLLCLGKSSSSSLFPCLLKNNSTRRIIPGMLWNEIGVAPVFLRHSLRCGLESFGSQVSPRALSGLHH